MWEKKQMNGDHPRMIQFRSSAPIHIDCVLSFRLGDSLHLDLFQFFGAVAGRSAIVGRFVRSVVWQGSQLELGADLGFDLVGDFGVLGQECFGVLAALGEPLLEAVKNAKTYVTNAIRCAPAVGTGHSPGHHFYFIESEDFKTG